jgi:CheY-like chemotaxis protein
VQKTNQSAADLVRQLLAFARRQAIQPRLINLNVLIHSMEKILRQVLPPTIELIMQTEPQLGQVRIEAGQMEQVVMNLALNARDAMPGDGLLIIRTSNITFEQKHKDSYLEIPPGRYVLLTVTDTGVGMTEEVLAHIFEPFFTTKEVGRGTGLGLSSCFGIIRQNNGYISVRSKPGRGTIFSIYLPYLEPVFVEPAREYQVGPSTPGDETILLVEDEMQVRALLAEMLRQYGYTVLEASNGEEALHLLRSRPQQVIHLIITDMVMPKMGGKALANLLRVIYPNLKVLFMSGYADAENISGGAAFLSKPFTLRDLAYKVRELLSA